MLQHFEEIKFVQEENLVTAMNCIQGALLNDGELPVKVEAAMALSAFLASQEKVEKILEPNVSFVPLDESYQMFVEVFLRAISHCR